MDQTGFEQNNTQNFHIESDVPECTMKEPCWLGIDEAGRGPVLGPMVYGTCYSPISMKEDLKTLQFADSKTLTEEKRDSIFEKLNDAKHLIGWMVEIISPHNISTNMLRRAKVNLNILSHDCAIRLIQRVLDRGVNVKEIYVDTVGDPAKYQTKLKELFPEIDITVAAKADANYEIVGAASICAKVARDKAVKRWTFNEGIEIEDNDYGSGYPGDPNTKMFLTNYVDKVFGFPSFVRFSWSTADKLIEEHCVNVCWEDDDEEENESFKNTPSVMSFFAKKDDSQLERHKFFKERCLISVDKL